MQMTVIELYRANAALQRDAARQTNLTNRREIHERSAMLWEAMANAAEALAKKGLLNAAAKRDSKSLDAATSTDEL